MAIRSFLQVKGTSIKFNSRNDVLNFDSGSAADVNFSVSESGVTLKLGTDSVILRGVEELGQLSSANFTFADGSRILIGNNIGNNKGNTPKDDSSNILVGTVHNDLLIGLGGNDILDGRDGSDTYVVFGNGDGTDRYRDSGTTGVDRIVAGSNGTVIGLGVNFSNTLTGIEAISANGFAGVKVVGSSKADLLNFTGVSLSGVSVIDAQAGSDTIIGSNGDDKISGGAGNDSIDGAAGRDTALFAGTRKSYSITIIAGSSVLVKDLDPMTNGNDGTDTLKNVELLQFLDGTVDLTSPPPPPVPNSAPVARPVTLAAIGEDSGARLITSAELLAGVTDVDGPAAAITALTIASGRGTLADNGNGSWSYTPALNDDSAVVFNYIASDGTLSASSTASLDITPVNDAPVATPVTLAAIEEDSGTRRITSAELLAGVTDVDGPAATITALTIASGNGTLADNGDGSWSYTPALNDDSAVLFNYTASDGTLSASSTASLDITPVNDAPVATPVTLAAIAEDSGARLITSAQLLAGVTDVDGPAAVITTLKIASGNGTLADNGDGSWSYTPALNDDSSVIFSYTASDGTLSASSTASLDITPVNDAPVATPVTLAAIEEDSGTRLITSAELLAGVTDVDGPAAVITTLKIASGNGTLTDNGDGSWSYTPALNDDSSVIFSYTASDGTLSASSTASLDITPVNDAPVATPVTLAAIEEDSGTRLITSAELLAGVTDVDGPAAVITTLKIASGNGTLTDNGDGSWSYTPALNDDSSVLFNYTASDGTLSASSTASLDITPVNDAPVATPVTLAAIEEDSGTRLITSAELLAGVTDVDGPAATITAFSIAAGRGTLTDNGDGSWSYTPALNDDSAVIFSYTASDGTLSASSTASLDITPVNDAPVATPVTLAAIEEDSGTRLITSAELLAGVTDVDGPATTITALTIAAGAGTLTDNGDGSWSYTPALNDDSAVIFNYTASDGTLSASSTASLDITPVDDPDVNDAPVATPVTLAAIEEDSGTRFITSAELLAGVTDVDDGPATTITALTIAAGAGTLTDNGDGSWSYTPALNDDSAVIFNYTASDGTLSASSTASLDITPVNDAPVATPVTLAAIEEDSGARLITSAELLAGVTDVDGPAATITALTIATGAGTLTDNGDGSWSYTPALNDDSAVLFNYTASDGTLSASSTASLDITPVNDAPVATPVTLAAIEEDSGTRLITSAELLAGVTDVDGPAARITALTIAAGAGTLIDNGDGSWNYTPALNDDSAVLFNYTASDGTLSASSTASLDITPVNDAPVATPVTLAAIEEDSGTRLITSAELLAGVTDVDGPAATITALTIATGAGKLTDNGDGSWSYTSALNDDSAVIFNYTASDGTLSASSTASLDITPVNDAPVATPVTLAAIEEDSGTRRITSAELLAGVTDVDGPAATITALTIASGNGTLADNGDGSWSYTPALDDDSAVIFNYTASDGALSASSTASLDITPVNDAPVATPVTLAAIEEDSGTRLISSAELLAGVTDVDGPAAAITALTIATGAGTLTDNGDGSWSYTSVLNDDSAVIFNYTASDGTLSASSTASLDIRPVNDAPVATPVTLAAIEEDSGTRLISSAELLAGVTDVDGPAATITALTIATGAGTLTDNGDGSWSYTSALNDDSAVIFNYTASDGTLSASSTASLDIRPVNDAPVATPVTLAAIEEDSGTRLITSAELLAGVTDVDGPAARITALTIAAGAGTLIDNGDGSWNYTPALNDDSAVLFNYTASDGTLSASSTASLDITPVNDAPVATPVTLAAIEEDSGTRLITSAELRAGVTDVDGPAARITALTIAAGAGTLIDNGDGSWNYTPALNDDSAVLFNYTASDGTLSASSTASLDILPVDDGQVNVAPVAVADTASAFEDGAPVLIDVLANDTDANVGDTKTVVSVNGDRLQGTAVGVAADGSAVVYSIGHAFQFLGAGETEIETFSYTMADALGARSTADVQVTVTGRNDAPLAVQDFRILSEDSGPVTLDVLLNDTDADASDTKTVVSVNTTGLQGSVAIAANGSALIYTVGPAFQALNQGQTANDGFSYTMQDSAGVRSTANVTVTVVGANEAPPPGSIIGSAFNDIINTTNAADTIFGLTGDDQISSAGGADTLFGGPGKDTLDGGAGNDVLVGDNDRDELTGGAGADIFRFDFLSDSTVLNPDKILDFSSAEGDRIDLRLIDANTAAAGDNAFSLSASFTGIAGQLVFDQATSLVQGDVNGDASADFAISVRLAGGGALSAGDFLL